MEDVCEYFTSRPKWDYGRFKQYCTDKYPSLSSGDIRALWTSKIHEYYTNGSTTEKNKAKKHVKSYKTTYHYGPIGNNFAGNIGQNFVDNKIVGPIPSFWTFDHLSPGTSLPATQKLPESEPSTQNNSERSQRNKTDVEDVVKETSAEEGENGNEDSPHIEWRVSPLSSQDFYWGQIHNNFAGDIDKNFVGNHLAGSNPSRAENSQRLNSQYPNSQPGYTPQSEGVSAHSELSRDSSQLNPHAQSESVSGAQIPQSDISAHPQPNPRSSQSHLETQRSEEVPSGQRSPHEENNGQRSQRSKQDDSHDFEHILHNLTSSIIQRPYSEARIRKAIARHQFQIEILKTILRCQQDLQDNE